MAGSGDVVAGPILARGILDNFVETYRNNPGQFASQAPGIVKLGVQVGELSPLFGYPEAIPMPERVPWGRRGTNKTFRYRTFPGINYRWKTNLRWLRMHRELGQLSDIYRDAQRAADRYALHADLVVSEILRGAATQLPGTLVAPDGVGIFSATVPSGADRFGVVGGNIVGGQSFASASGLEAAVFRCIERMQTFLDTQGQPFFPSIKNVDILIPASFAQIATRAFEATYNQSGTNADAGNTQIPNTFQAGGYNINVQSSAYFTETTRIYVAVRDYDPAPIQQTVALGLEETFYDKNNSEELGDAGLEKLMMETWFGFTLGLPINICVATT